MGCDIHVHVEIKLNDKWEHYNHLQIGRNYRLFGKICGVRSDEEDPLVKERPLPEDISTVTKFDFNLWEADAHTITWLTKDEAKQIQEWHEHYMGDRYKLPLWGYVFGNHLWDEESGVQDSRVIIWFDN